jgi:hypothetical protein
MRHAQNEGDMPSGTLYPTNDLWFARGKTSEALATRILDSEGRAISFGEGVIEMLLRVRAHALMSFGESSTVFLIAETVLNRPTPEFFWTELSKVFEEVHCVIFARQQDFAISSRIAQRIKMSPANKKKALHSSKLSISEIVKDSPSFWEMNDYALQIRRWEPRKPNHHLHVIPYFETEQPSFQIVEDFFAIAGDEYKPSLNPAYKNFLRSNVSPASDQLDQLRHKKLALALLSPSYQLERAKLLDEMRELRENIKKQNSSIKPWRLPDDERLTVIKHYQHSNSLLKNRVDSLGSKERWEKWFSEIENRQRYFEQLASQKS